MLDAQTTSYFLPTRGGRVERVWGGANVRFKQTCTQTFGPQDAQTENDVREGTYKHGLAM